MPTIEFRIADEVLDAFPGTRVAGVVAHGVDNTGRSPAVAEARRRAPAVLRDALGGRPLADHPHVQAWRRTYRRFGVDPTKKRPSAEALARRVLRTGELPEVSDVVDLYNAASVAALVPAGGYDLASLRSPLVLRGSPGEEPFAPLGASAANESTQPGEIVYADASGVLTRAWNHRDGERTKIQPSTTSLLLLCEAADDELGTEALEACAAAMESLLRDACGAATARLRLDASRPSAELPGVPPT